MTGIGIAWNIDNNHDNDSNRAQSTCVQSDMLEQYGTVHSVYNTNDITFIRHYKIVSTRRSAYRRTYDTIENLR